jgi:hypothetical protein
MEASDSRGRCQCVTCGVVKDYRYMHAGHFVAGRTLGVLFEETNIHPQCARCNIDLGGNVTQYEFYMHYRYGQEEIERLRKRRREIVNMTRGELVAKRKAYRRRIKIQEVRLGKR